MACNSTNMRVTNSKSLESDSQLQSILHVAAARSMTSADVIGYAQFCRRSEIILYKRLRKERGARGSRALSGSWYFVVGEGDKNHNFLQTWLTGELRIERGKDYFRIPDDNP